MNKRLLKRHKRQVARAKEHVKISEPDLRTPEQIKAAREASRPAVGHAGFSAPGMTSSQRGIRPVGKGGGAKTDA